MTIAIEMITLVRPFNQAVAEELSGLIAMLPRRSAAPQGMTKTSAAEIPTAVGQLRRSSRRRPRVLHSFFRWPRGPSEGGDQAEGQQRRHHGQQLHDDPVRKREREPDDQDGHEAHLRRGLFLRSAGRSRRRRGRRSGNHCRGHGSSLDGRRPCHIRRQTSGHRSRDVARSGPPQPSDRSARPPAPSRSRRLPTGRVDTHRSRNAAAIRHHPDKHQVSDLIPAGPRGQRLGLMWSRLTKAREPSG